MRAPIVRQVLEGERQSFVVVSSGHFSLDGGLIGMQPVTVSKAVRRVISDDGDPIVVSESAFQLNGKSDDSPPF